MTEVTSYPMYLGPRLAVTEQFIELYLIIDGEVTDLTKGIASQFQNYYMHTFAAQSVIFHEQILETYKKMNLLMREHKKEHPDCTKAEILKGIQENLPLLAKLHEAFE